MAVLPPQPASKLSGLQPKTNFRSRITERVSQKSGLVGLVGGQTDPAGLNLLINHS